MARPEKNTVEYFPHYVNSGKTLYTLEKRYGNDGYAFLFKVLETLGKSENHFIDCRNPADWEFLLAITNVKEVIAEEMMQLLTKLGTFDEELWSHRIIFSPSFIENIKSVYERRKRNCLQKLDLCKQLSIKCIQKPRSADINANQSTQSIVKESIVKESKVKNKTPKKIFGDSCFEFQISKSFLEKNSDKAQIRFLVEKQGAEKILQDWADEVRKLKEIDGYTEKQIAFVFDYTAQHDFWKEQIFSVKKFRQKNKAGVPYFVVIVDEIRKQSQNSQIADFSD